MAAAPTIPCLDPESLQWRALVLADIPDIGIAADATETARVAAALSARWGTRLVATDAWFGPVVSRKALLPKLAELAAWVAEPHRGVWIYKNGHGNDCPRAAASGGGLEDMWCLWGGGTLHADELSAAFAATHAASALVVVSDNCSSGTMLRGPGMWASIGACTDTQDALADCDGGVFTEEALLPVLEGSRDLRSLRAVFDAACARIDLPTSTPQLHAGTIALLDVMLL